VTEKIRFGIIGAGVIGPTHAKAISSLPDAELVAVTDVIPERANTLADTYGIHAYTDIQSMLDKEQLDVVDICTPSGMHGEHTIQAMRAGCNVIVEKPMEITHERVLAMQMVQRETGVKLAVISQHRFDEASIQVKKLLTEKAFGRLVLGNAVVPWWRSQGYYDSGAWRGTWALDGGGALMNQSIHSIDVLQWLMGRVKTIKAYTATLAHTMETEDVAVAVLRFENDALETIAATTGAYPGVDVRIALYGDQGSAVIEADTLGYLHLARAEETSAGAYGGGGANQVEQITSAQQSTASDPAALSYRAHALEIADMIAAIREDRAPLVDGKAGQHPVDIILGIYESARTGKEVVLS
jgi:Predicted dehydrogenases and related proteins